MSLRLSGIWFKLVEPDGFYLGILMVPGGVADGIEGKGRWRCAGRPKMTVFQSMPPTTVDASIAMIDFVSADHLMRDAIMMFGITVSDINQEPGFAFIPSADYMARGPNKPAKVKGRDVQTQAVATRFSVLDFADE